MTEIEELSSRITSALDRVAGGVQAAVDAGGEAENLRTALEQEKQVSAQLSDRVRALGERQEQALAAMEARATEAATRMEKLDTEMQQLRTANEMLMKACEDLRAANAEGVGNPDLINQSVMAELQALRAARTAERAEADEILAGLMPLLNASAPSEATEETS